MNSPSFPQSFDATADVVVTGPKGQRAHTTLHDHTARLGRKLWNVRPGVWCLVGNGLSNQTFIEGPEGLIAIDTGESVQEMTAALAEVRAHTDTPVVAVMYTHFHYVTGTQAIFDEAGPEAEIKVWGHERIVGNRQRYGLEVSAAAGRGLVHQFGISLPEEGPDAIANVGLGLFFRDPTHAPFTEGFVAPTVTVGEPTKATIAGLDVYMAPFPSDADDNMTLWFPDIGVCVNNHVWPTLFNVFAIRGEEYRDPRVLLAGLDHIQALGADHLLCAHGPPLSGADDIAKQVTDYRDSIAFMWDQTVRGINRGLTCDELTEFVQLPERFADSYFTQQLYGLVEHHVRQIHSGLRGWFDGYEPALFPVAHVERHRKLVEGFGGADEVRRQAAEAVAKNDLRWALELASWLVRSEVDEAGRADAGSQDDRQQLASVLRAIAQRTTSSNSRNWCLTRALELEDSLDVARHRIHRFGMGAVLGNPPAASVHALRVVLDPRLAEGQHIELAWSFSDGTVTGLRLRDGVAVPTDGSAPDTTIELDHQTWAKVLGGKLSLADALSSGAIATNDPATVTAFLNCFDIASLKP